MEIGIALPHYGTNASPEAIVHVAQSAEQIGLGSLWVLERWLRPTAPVNSGWGPPAVLADYYGTVYDPIETLTFVAAKTSRIKLGTSIIVAPLHSPVLLGRRFATLDQFSGGRAIAGLGQGWMDEEFRTANVSKKYKGEGFGEFIEAMRAVWGPNPVSYQGKLYQIPEFQIDPKPVQVGGPPIIAAANAPAAIERAARLADGINPFFMNRDQFQQMVTGFRDMAEAAGRDSQKLQIVIRSNSYISETAVAPEQRQPMNGSLDQISDDLRWLAALNINHVFFDLNMSYVPVDKQLSYVDQLHRTFVQG